MPTILKTKNSVTTTVAPTSLAQGELAVNITDKKMWVGNAATTPVQILGAGVTNDAGGSNTQVQFNSSGTLAGSANMTFNGTTLTVNDFTDSSLTANRVVYAGTAGNLVNSANFTFNGTTVTMANDASISGLTVGKGGSAVVTNTAIGGNALNANTTGNTNTAVGFNSLVANTTGTENTGIGVGALETNTTGLQNTGIGREALDKNTTANANTAVGYRASFSNTTGTFNVSLGVQSLNGNTTGSNNTGLGYQALLSNTTASNNTAVGHQAGNAQTTGGIYSGFSTYLGHTAGLAATGAANTLIGQQAGSTITTGDRNTLLGRYNGNQGGLDIRTASNYIVLSDGDGNPRFGSTSNNLVLFGTNAYIASQNSSLFAYGNLSSSSGVVLANNATSWASTSDERRKDIIEPIIDAVSKVSQLRSVIGKFKSDEEGTRRPFLIAQDVQAVLPEAVQSQTDKEGDFLSMSYTDVVPLLVAAIKELNEKVEAQALEIAQLKGN